MAIWGGDGSSKENTRYADTWDDFIALFKDGNYTFIGFPTHDQEGNLIPISERVIDLRRYPWITETSAAGVNNDGKKVVYGNNWTILGPSIRNCFLLKFSQSSETNAYLYDLTIKNAYVFAFENSRAGIFETYGRYYKYFYRVKVSATFDGVGGSAMFSYGTTGTNQDVLLMYNCSLNFKIHGSFYLRTSAYAALTMENCLINLQSSEYGHTGKTDLLDDSVLRFCKIQGSIKLGNWNFSTDVYKIIRPANYSAYAYNVIDLEVHKSSSITTPLKCGVDQCASGSTLACFLINKTKIENNGFTFYSGENPNQQIVGVTQEQLTNRDYLESVYFLVGETPIDD